MVFSLAILYLTYALKLQHDALNETFTYVFASLCAFAALCGLVGTCFNSRAMLLFFYINQLWGLSNVGTFFVMDLETNEQSYTACRLYEAGELTLQQLQDSNLDCEALERSSCATPHAAWHTRTHGYSRWSFILVLRVVAACSAVKIDRDRLL